MASLMKYIVALCLMLDHSATHIIREKGILLQVKEDVDMAWKPDSKGVHLISTTGIDDNDLVGKTKANDDLVKELNNPVKFVTSYLQNRFAVHSGKCQTGFVKQGELCLPEDYDDH